MKTIGLIKEVDKMGRLGIPKQIRDRMNLNGKVELIMTSSGLLIKKYVKEKADKE